MKMIATPARPAAAPPMSVEDLELMDDFAHTSGRARHLEIANHVALPFDPQGMASRWRRRAEESRGNAHSLIEILRIFGLHPEAHMVRVDGCDWTEKAARKELAQELNYTGDMNDSAAMNIWLHRQVMTRLAQNGGRVPANLRD